MAAAACARDSAGKVHEEVFATRETGGDIELVPIEAVDRTRPAVADVLHKTAWRVVAGAGKAQRAPTRFTDREYNFEARARVDRCLPPGSAALAIALAGRVEHAAEIDRVAACREIPEQARALGGQLQPPVEFDRPGTHLAEALELRNPVGAPRLRRRKGVLRNGGSRGGRGGLVHGTPDGWRGRSPASSASTTDPLSTRPAERRERDG